MISSPHATKNSVDGAHVGPRCSSWDRTSRVQSRRIVAKGRTAGQVDFPRPCRCVRVCGTSMGVHCLISPGGAMLTKDGINQAGRGVVRRRVQFAAGVENLEGRMLLS